MKLTVWFIFNISFILFLFLNFIALDGVGEIASLLKTLDLNSSIDMWRNFGKFAVKHQQNFKEINCDKIVANFQQMATDITILLPSLMKVKRNSLKCSKHFLVRI